MYEEVTVGLDKLLHLSCLKDQHVTHSVRIISAIIDEELFSILGLPVCVRDDQGVKVCWM